MCVLFVASDLAGKARLKSGTQAAVTVQGRRSERERVCAPGPQSHPTPLRRGPTVTGSLNGGGSWVWSLWTTAPRSAGREDLH